MIWSSTTASVMIVLAASDAFAGIAASAVIFWQIISHGGWKLAEPSVIKSRCRMIRPWMLAVAVKGLLMMASRSPYSNRTHSHFHLQLRKS